VEPTKVQLISLTI